MRTPRVLHLCLTLSIATAASVMAQELPGEVEITESDRDHWAFLPIQRPDVPTSGSTWVRGDIDEFILAKLSEESLQPIGPASRGTLIRRLYLDLTGLPPSPHQVRAFLADQKPNAYARLVDELLASPEFGKRWGQYWLDLARFAETDGFEHDKVRTQAWRYRDWVIDAVNEDFPYDRFVRWQIAGDLIEPKNERAKLATAFCLSGPDMPDINSQEERHHVLMNEITSTVGSVFMSLQFGCAQCHDHKYDAISQADFYRLRAFFDPAVRLKKNQSVNVLASFSNQTTSHVMERGDWRSKGAEVNAAFPRVLHDMQRSSISAKDRSSLATWLTARENPITARVIVNRIWQHHFGQGLSTSPSDFGIMGDEPTHPQLLDYLATELVRDQWSLKKLHRNIVLSAVYRSRSAPLPEELDAWENSVRKDPSNRLLARFPRRRLQAEVIRDSMLAVSGLLNNKSGGESVSPPLPAEMLKTLLRGQWKASDREADHYRRSIYVFARRNLRYPFFATFDRPSADLTCSVRDKSTTAIQSLMLLNSDLTMNAARHLSVQMARPDLSDTELVRDLFLRSFSREPHPKELQDTIEFLKSQSNSGNDAIAWQELCRALFNANEFIYVD